MVSLKLRSVIAQREWSRLQVVQRMVQIPKNMVIDTGHHHVTIIIRASLLTKAPKSQFQKRLKKDQNSDAHLHENKVTINQIPQKPGA